MKSNKERNVYFSEDEYKQKSRNYYLEPEKEITDVNNIFLKLKQVRWKKM